MADGLMQTMARVAMVMLGGVWIGLIWLVAQVATTEGSFFEPRSAAVLLLAVSLTASVAAVQAFRGIRQRPKHPPLGVFWLSTFTVWSCALGLTFAANLNG